MDFNQNLIISELIDIIPKPKKIEQILNQKYKDKLINKIKLKHYVRSRDHYKHQSGLFLKLEFDWENSSSKDQFWTFSASLPFFCSCISLFLSCSSPSFQYFIYVFNWLIFCYVVDTGNKEYIQISSHHLIVQYHLEIYPHKTDMDVDMNSEEDKKSSLIMIPFTQLRSWTKTFSLKYSKIDPNIQMQILLQFLISYLGQEQILWSI